jgi:hypothetical protein
MKLLNSTQSQVTVQEFTIEDETSVFIYKEIIEDGHVIDSILRDKDGFEIDDPVLFDKVCNFVDTLLQNGHFIK